MNSSEALCRAPSIPDLLRAMRAPPPCTHRTFEHLVHPQRLRHASVRLRSIMKPLHRPNSLNSGAHLHMLRQRHTVELAVDCCTGSPNTYGM